MLMYVVTFHLYGFLWSIFHFRNSVLSTREVDQRTGFCDTMEKVTADFFHQADLKSQNSDKSLTNLIPD